jgi:hypothetical protein
MIPHPVESKFVTKQLLSQFGCAEKVEELRRDSKSAVTTIGQSKDESYTTWLPVSLSRYLPAQLDD